MDPGITFSDEGDNIWTARFTSFSLDGATNANQAKFYLDTLLKINADHPGELINVINDTRLISKEVRNLSNEARATYLEAYKNPAIGHVAMVGFGPWLKNFISMLAQFAGRSAQTRFFDTPEEALTWLRGESSAGSTTTPPAAL